MSYSVAPETKITPVARPDVQLGVVSADVEPLPDGVTEEELPFIPSDNNSVPGLSVEMIVLIAVGILVVCLGGLCVLYVLPLYFPPVPPLPQSLV